MTLRKVGSLVIGSLVIAGAILVWRSSQPPVERPNVIFVLVDTLRADYLGCYGFEGDISPNIDTFADRSVHFTRCMSQAPWTAPSVGSYFTSRYPFPSKEQRGGFRISILPEKHETIAEVFQESGYATAAFVENGLLVPQHGFSQGFELYSRKQQARQPYNALEEFKQWYRGRDAQQPFFAYIHVMDVHGPYRYLEQNYEAIKDSVSLGPDRRITMQEHADRPKPLGEHIPWLDEPEGEHTRSWRAAYAAGVRLFDHKFGDFVRDLEESGLLENSVLVFTSDHGEQLLDDGGWGHGHNLRHYQTNVPLVIHAPKFVGTKISELVSLIDLAPTLAQICHLTPASDHWEGRDLMPLMRGAKMEQRAAFSTSVIGNPYEFSMLHDDHLLIWNPDEGTHRLFDVSQPSWARRNLTDEMPMIVDDMKSDLDLHIARLRAQEPLMSTDAMSDEMLKAVRALGYVK